MGDKIWYAVYTRPRYEKKVAKHLIDQKINCYLPLVKTLRQWSDRKKWVELPLFSSYVFVQIDPSQYYQALNTIGVVRFVTFEGKPAQIPDQQIENIKWILSTDIPVDTIDEKIPEGSEVEIIKGPLRGLRAEMINYNNKNVILLRVKQLDKHFEIHISKNHVKKL